MLMLLLHQLEPLLVERNFHISSYHLFFALNLLLKEQLIFIQFLLIFFILPLFILLDDGGDGDVFYFFYGDGDDVFFIFFALSKLYRQINY
jgi:hypothetical protein